MSRLQELVTRLVQVIAKYHLSQTNDEQNIDELCRMSDVDLHLKLTELNKAARPDRQTLLAYILATVDIIRPLVNSGQLLTAPEKLKIERILTSFIVNLLTLLSISQNNGHIVTIDQVGMVKLSNDPKGMPRDMIYKMLPDMFTYIQYGSEFYYLQKYVGLIELTPGPSAQLDRLFPAEFDVPALATPAKLNAIKETTGHDCAGSQMTVKGMVSRCRFTQSWQTVTNEFIIPMALNTKSTEHEIRQLIRKWIGKHQNSLQTVALTHELRQLTETSTAEISALRSELGSLRQEHALVLREKDDEIARLRTRAEISEREIAELRIQNSELRQKRDPVAQVKSYEAASTSAYLTRAGFFPHERSTGPFFSRVMLSGDSPTGPSSP
ncbi:hypothetical protein [Legionella sp. CNM-4043-24]|uniref:hypothetical protein n=1 Tax=Legionella sp. CNM-4043-24 TaxID=3421646 RepID=UPI00403B2466